MSLAAPLCGAQDSDTDFLLCREDMTPAAFVYAMICMVDLPGELAVDDHGYVYPLQ